MITSARWATVLVFALGFIVLATGRPLVAADPVGIYVVADSLVAARSGPTATLLDDGRVFLAGGSGAGGAPLATTEIHDPATDSATAGPAMGVARLAHTATLLPDGRVLIAGGFTTGFVAVASVEIYDPATDTFAAAPDMAAARSSHTATLLSTGSVLVAGGFTGPGGVSDSAELFDPDASAGPAWSATGSLAEGREAHSATLLADGTVLIAAGQGNFPLLRASAEIYDPAAATFSLTGSLGLARWWHTTTLLPDGRVLVTGGNTDFTTGAPTDSVERFDPLTGSFTTVGTLDAVRVNHSANLLSDDTILIVGGGSATPERWDLETDGFEPGGMPVTGGRSEHTATTLLDGRIFIAGGASAAAAPLSATELYIPDGAVVPGGSATVPDFTTLGPSLAVDTFDSAAGDITFTTGLFEFFLPVSSLPFPSPSVTVSLTPVTDLPGLAALVPLPGGASFLPSGVVVLDAFASGLPIGSFPGPATLTAFTPPTVLPEDILVFELLPALSISQVPPDLGFAWSLVSSQPGDSSVSWNLNGPGIFALGLAPASEPGPLTLDLATTASANFVVWTSGATTASEIFDDPAVDVAWRWNGRFWQSFTPNAPPALRTDFTLGAGPAPDVLWVVTSGPLSVTAPAGGLPPPVGPNVILATGESADFVAWRGGVTTAAGLFGGLDTVTVAWRWSGFAWDSFIPVLGIAGGDGFALGVDDQPDLLWLVTSGPVEVSLNP